MVKKKECRICKAKSVVVNWDIFGFDVAHQKQCFEITCLNEKCLAYAKGKTMVECWDNYKKLIERCSGENGKRK